MAGLQSGKAGPTPEYQQAPAGSGSGVGPEKKCVRKVLGVVSRAASGIFLAFCLVWWILPNWLGCGFELNCIVGDAQSYNGMFGFEPAWSGLTPNSPFWLREFRAMWISSGHPWFPAPSFGGASGHSWLEIPWWLLASAGIVWLWNAWREGIASLYRRWKNAAKPDPATAFPVIPERDASDDVDQVKSMR
jgi:hypothetical protein